MDMNENAARVDWARVECASRDGFSARERSAWRSTGLGDPERAARATELAAWAAQHPAEERAAELLEAFVAARCDTGSKAQGRRGTHVR